MPTIREYCSIISNQAKSLGIDSYIPYKFIYKQTQGIIADFLSKSNNSNRLTYKIVSGWSEIDNIQMEEVPISECNLDINQCQKLMRTKEKLPDIYESKFGSMTRTVASLNFNTSYTNIFSPKQWVATTKRQFQSQKYFFIINGFLYIPITTGKQPSPEEIRIDAYFKDKYEVEKFIAKNSEHCSDCPKETDLCKKPLDYELVIPSFLEDDVKKELLNTLSQTYLKIPKDENSNMNNNQKDIDPRDKK